MITTLLSNTSQYTTNGSNIKDTDWALMCWGSSFTETTTTDELSDPSCTHFQTSYEISYFDDELIKPLCVLGYQFTFYFYLSAKNDLKTSWFTELGTSGDRIIGNYSLVGCFEIGKVEFRPMCDETSRLTVLEPFFSCLDRLVLETAKDKIFADKNIDQWTYLIAFRYDFLPYDRSIDYWLFWQLFEYGFTVFELSEIFLYPTDHFTFRWEKSFREKVSFGQRS